jgi:hypothetical protein
MKLVPRALRWGPGLAALALTTRPVLGAEDQAGQADEADEPAASTAGKPSAPAGGPTTTPTYPGTWGLPAPGTDINAGLPSSSRPTTDTSRSSDSFDLEKSHEGPGTLHGSASGDSILPQQAAASTPRVYTVRQGDTLWDLCDHYYKNPWQWPEVWAKNPQIQNPNWIYPGDELRLGGPGGAAGPGGGAGPRSGTNLVQRGGGLVPRTTVFLRDYGYIGDPQRDNWGKLVGANEDQMLLGEGNRVYLLMRPGVTPEPGQNLTVFTHVRKPDPVKGARKPSGAIVTIKGTVRVEGFDPKTRVARGQVIESLDAIERGASIGPVGRRFDVVPPVPTRSQMTARILTGLYPHVHFGPDQLVFIDRGSDDGLVPGNRLFVLRRGDAWRRTLDTAGKMTKQTIRIDVPDPAHYETTPLEGGERDFPEEIVGELRVLRTQKFTSIALVTGSNRELVPGDRAVTRPGE